MIGIYKITNPKGKIYIGQSINIENRFKRYKWHNCKNQIMISRSIDKYGFANHLFEIIEECKIEDLNIRERYWQEYYDVLNPTKGLNLKYTETSDNCGKLSNTTKEKISKGNKGKQRTEEEKLNLSIKNKGKILSEEHKSKISESNKKNKKNKNITLSEEQKIKISNSLKEYYKYSPSKNKGIKKGIINNKLQAKQVLEIRQLLLKGEGVLQISKLYNVSKATIQHIKQGKTWQSLGEFKLIGKAPIIKTQDLELLYSLYEQQLKVKEIQEILGYSTVTIAKYRKIWKQKITN